MAAQPPHPVEIRVEGLHRSFDSNAVLRGVDLQIDRGEVVAIVGGSGCGKTVLLEHIIGQLAPDSGRVLIANHEIPGAPLADLATLNETTMDQIRIHWSIVFQRNALLTGTVYENIALWLREVEQLDEAEIHERALRSMRAVGLDPDTVLARDRDELSGGMAKRVAIARAIARDPVLIFYDEPTTGLDPHLADRIQQLIAEMHSNGLPSGVQRTSVIITHDKDLLRRIEPRVIMLHEGRVFFDGPYRSFRESDSPIIRPYFELMPALHLRPMANARTTP